MESFKEQTVAVVGGGSEIGRAIGEAVHARGGSVVLSSRNEVKLNEVAKSMEGAEVLPIDITDTASIES